MPNTTVRAAGEAMPAININHPCTILALLDEFERLTPANKVLALDHLRALVAEKGGAA